MDVEALLALPYFGNHHSDSDLISALTAFYMDFRNAKADRIRALHRVDEVMGITQAVPDEEAYLDKAVADVIEMVGADGLTMFPHAFSV